MRSSKRPIDLMRGMYPKPIEDQEILVDLLRIKDVSLISFNKLDQKIIKKLEGERSVTIKGGKVELTPIRVKIVQGTKRI